MLFGAFFLVIVAIVCAYLFAADIQFRSENAKKEYQEFYQPYIIDDSTFHLNVSDNSCVLFEVINDTLYVRQNNVEFIRYDKDAHKLLMQSHNSDRTLKSQEICLDTMFINVPNNVKL
jgi:hypothetical protein